MFSVPKGLTRDRRAMKSIHLGAARRYWTDILTIRISVVYEFSLKEPPVSMPTEKNERTTDLVLPSKVDQSFEDDLATRRMESLHL